METYDLTIPDDFTDGVKTENAVAITGDTIVLQVVPAGLDKSILVEIHGSLDNVTYHQLEDDLGMGIALRTNRHYKRGISLYPATGLTHIKVVTRQLGATKGTLKIKLTP